MVTLSDETILTPDGRSLHGVYLSPTSPELACVVLHGLGEHSGYYRKFARLLGEQRIASLLYDMHGHGKSPGRRGDAPSLDALVDDLDTTIKSALHRWPNLPLVLFGHSFGGHLVLRYLMTRQFTCVKHAILSNPMILPDSPPTKPQAFAAWVTSHLLPHVRVSAEIDSEELTNNSEAITVMDSDPLRHDQLAIGIGGQLMSSGHELVEFGNQFDSHMLFLLGDDDSLCDTRTTRQVIEQCVHAATTKFAGMKHSLLMEQGNEQVHQAILQWLHNRFPARHINPAKRSG